MNLINKLYRIYKREKKEDLRISDKEEPLIISKTRMALLELEIKTLAYILSRELKTSFQISNLSEIKWAEITTDDLDRLESILFENVYEIEIKPIVKSLISILRGLLDTHNKFFNGKAMPFYVKLKNENVQSTFILEESVDFPFRNDRLIKQCENINSSNATPKSYFSSRTPRNLPEFNQKVELPIKSRSNHINLISSTPRSTSCQTPRTKNYMKHTNLDYSTPKSEINKKNYYIFSDSNTPRRSLKTGICGNSKISNQQGSIMAAKALLGLSVNIPATEQDIRKAYLKAAMKWHPDKINSSTNEKSHICFTAIQNAMEILLQNMSKNGEV
ncbi:DnaJ domain containing protein [Cryptosporidium tyzzeri]|nr:DnaJ domain containing protein [Cryptosporidium tyzzeri]